MKYIVIQSRWIRGSKQNGERAIECVSRKREAAGLARHHFNSNLEVTAKHLMYDVEDWELDEENLSITLADEEGLWYHTRFYMREE